MAIKLDYVALDSKSAVEGLLLSADAEHYLQSRLLERLGLKASADESALNVWGRHLHAINGLEFSRPWNKAIAEAVLSDAGASRFMFALT